VSKPERRISISLAGVRQVSPAALTVIVLVLLPALYLHGLGTADIIGDDEAREVGIIQDIAERGHWVLPRFNDTVYPDKPVLYHWLAAAACSVGGGWDERLVRLPSAVSALAVVGVVGLAGVRLFDVPAGIAAALLLGLSPFLFEHARVARPDTLVTLMLTAALFTFYAWWNDGCRSRSRAAAVGTLFGIAVLAKGPVAPVVGAVTILAFLALRRQLGQGRALLRAHVLLPFLVTGGAWYAAALAGWGEDFARKHLMGRYLGNVLGGDLALGVQPSHSLLHHMSFYPLHLLLATLPWAPLLVAAVISIYRDPTRRADPRLQFLQIWIATVVVVFSFAAFKLRHYLLPALPAAAMVASELTATLAQRQIRGARRSGASGSGRSAPARQAFIISLAGTLLIASVTSLWWWIGGPESLSRSDRELALTIEMAARARPGRAMLGMAGAALLCAACMYLILRRRWRELLGLVTAGVLAWMLTIQPTLQSELVARASLKPFVAAVKRNVPEGDPLYFFGQALRPVVVYWGRPIPRLRRDLAYAGSARAYIMVTEEDLPRLLETDRHVRTIVEHVGRIGNLARGRVLLVEVKGSP